MGKPKTWEGAKGGKNQATLIARWGKVNPGTKKLYTPEEIALEIGTTAISITQKASRLNLADLKFLVPEDNTMRRDPGFHILIKSRLPPLASECAPPEKTAKSANNK